jgi:hypothetical protein
MPPKPKRGAPPVRPRNGVLEGAYITIRKIAPRISFANEHGRREARSVLVHILKNMGSAGSHLPLAVALVEKFSPVLDLELLGELYENSWNGIAPAARELLVSEMALRTISRIKNGSSEKIADVDGAMRFAVLQRDIESLIVLQEALRKNFTEKELVELRQAALMDFQ